MGTKAACGATWAKGLLACGLALMVLGAWADPQPRAQNAKATEAFELKIRPVLQAKCVACHGAKEPAGKLRLDQAVTPAQAHRIAEAISYQGTLKMPPGGKLPAAELAALTAWSKAGAPWPATPKARPKTNAPFWSFVPPQTPDVPKVRATWWAKNPVDAFVLEKLEEKGLKPAPVADRRTLIRRATFDLTGLPPTPSEIEAFLGDKQPGAFERVVDRLLASPAYGERWGRHWLDVARYADSNGLDENLVYPNAWRYRDWVIGAINSDKPIDRFIQEQVAGDLLPDAGDNGLIATGYLSLGAKMLAEDDPVKQELDVIDEQVDTLSKTYLGLTVGCARCHDHKFDPISAKDYYALAGIFKSTKTMVNYQNMAEWTERPIGPKENQEKLQKIEAEIRARRDEMKAKRETSAATLLMRLRSMSRAYEDAARRLVESEKNRTELKLATETEAGAIVREAEDFVTGNVSKDSTGFGKGIGVLVNLGEYPNRVSYEITLAGAGSYQLDMRYASGDARPLRVLANGTMVLGEAAGRVSGGFGPEEQKWFAEGIIPLNAGKNLLTFERDGYFPHIDKFLLVPRPGVPPTDSLGTIASTENLIPRVLRDVANRITNGGEVRIELPDPVDSVLPEEDANTLARLDREVRALEQSKPYVPLAMAVTEGTPTNMKVHLRGSYLTLGEESPRRFPSAISGPSQSPLKTSGSGRLELAQWLTDSKNPLTARVFVNRVWRWRFGRGLVASVDNFGALGDRPTHPELLDYLATTFVKDDGWSLKKFHKRLMLTNTYMMSGRYDKAAAGVDPDNHFLWRFPRKRLEVEAIRDSILFVSGTLDRTMGGTLLTFRPREYVTSTANDNPIKYDSPRRAVYLPVIRSAVYDAYSAFDFGDPTVMNGDRASTTVAPQALFMLNSSLVLNSTRAQAEALVKRTDLTDWQRIEQLYLVCYGRPATAAEVKRALDFLPKLQLAYAQAANPRLSAWQSLCKSMVAANEFIYVE